MKIAQNKSFMKHLFLTAIAVLSIFASCSKETKDVTNEITDSSKGSVVNINFKSSTLNPTRAFIDDMAVVQDWERQINYVQMYVFDNNEQLITHKRFEDTDIINGQVTFVLPGIVSGDYCTFYAVANTPITKVIETISDLNSIIIDDINTYNGAFEDVTTRGLRTDGFSMTAKHSMTIAEEGGLNNFSMDMYRNVAKLAIQTSIDPAFSSSTSGAIKVTIVRIHGAVSESTIVPDIQYQAVDHYYSPNQLSNEDNGSFRNLFYLFESNYQLRTIMFSYTYDSDGDFSTVNDQRFGSFTKPLPTAILKNGYMKINCIIKGIADLKPDVIFNICDWTSSETIEFEDNINL